MLLYKYTYYALFKDAFGDRVRMLYTNTDSLFLHFMVEDLAKEIMARPQLRDAFDFSEISSVHLFNLHRGGGNTHAEKVGYFKN